MHKSLLLIVVVAALLTAATTLVIGADKFTSQANSSKTSVNVVAEAAAPTCWSSNTWSGENDGDGFGGTVSGAGDMNNDGWDDYFVGAVSYGEGDLLTDTGRAYVYSGLDGSLLHTITAEAGGGWFGSSAATADLNNDGFDDLLVGSTTHSGTIQRGGRVYIFYGSAVTRPSVFSAADAEVIISGQVVMEGLGFDIAIMGEVDTIPGPDFAIGANHYQGFSPGEVFVLSGQTLDTLFTLTGDGTSPTDAFGTLGPAGDVNNDGIPDLVVGEPAYFAEPGRGAVYVFSGSDGSLLYKFTSDDETGGHLGSRPSAFPGDVNGDGYDDMLMSAENAGTNNAGRMYLFLSGPGPYPIVQGVENADRTWNGSGSSSNLGSACFLGDINQDGFDDYVVGASQWDANGWGYVQIISGVDGSHMHSFAGEELRDKFGVSVCSVGDRDGDGVGELMIGAIQKGNPGQLITGPGKAYVFEIGDVDADGWVATCDNCPMDYNPGLEDFDTDDYGDVCDICPRYATPGDIGFDTGDIDQDGKIDAADIILMVNYIFKSGPPPVPIPEAGDVNFDVDHKVTSADIIYEVNYVFKSGPAPLDACVL